VISETDQVRVVNRPLLLGSMAVRIRTRVPVLQLLLSGIDIAAVTYVATVAVMRVATWHATQEEMGR